MNRRHQIVGAAVGLLFGLAVFCVLFALSLLKESPGGASEDRMWLGLFASLWSMPLSGLLDVLAPNQGRSMKGVALVLAVNWMILGAVVGSVFDYRARRSLRAPH